jgi:tellurite resistance protein TerC
MTPAMPETLLPPHINSPFAWAALLVFIAAALGADFMSLRRQGNRVIGFRDALQWSLVWVALALVFCGGLWLALDLSDGREFANLKAGEFLTGYLIEKSLSVDNLFVFLMLFTAFQVPPPQQKKALMIGIIAAIVLRIVLILVGAWLISQFSWVMYLFGLFLLYTGAKMVVADEEEPDLQNNRLLKWMRRHLTVSHEYHGSALYLIKDGVRTFTPLFLVVAVIGVTDVMFALDSIPAIFAVTTDPYIVMSSNIFAVLGLRALYFMLAGMAERFHLLKFGLAAILVFIGTKMLIVDFYHIPVGASLAIVLAFLVVTMVTSLIVKPKANG